MKKLVLILMFCAISLFALDINSASVEEFDKIKGISKQKAEAIVKYREANGKFKNIHELKNIKGIGEKSIYNIKNDIVGKKQSKAKKEKKDNLKDKKNKKEKADK